MKTVWISDLKTAEERENFKQLFNHSQKLLDKLRQIVYNMVISREKVSTDQYDSPSWSHKQAHENGYNHALRDILELIKTGDHDK